MINGNRAQRRAHLAQMGRVLETKLEHYCKSFAPAGTKLRERFHASGNRMRYDDMEQHPCYGHRSKRKPA